MPLSYTACLINLCNGEVTIFRTNGIREQQCCVVSEHEQHHPAQASCVSNKWLIRGLVWWLLNCYLDLGDGDSGVRILVQHPQNQSPQLLTDLWSAQNTRKLDRFICTQDKNTDTKGICDNIQLLRKVENQIYIRHSSHQIWYPSAVFPNLEVTPG